jgi:hypothetical protein
VITVSLFESLFPKKEPLEHYATLLNNQLSQANEQLTTGSYAGLEQAVGIFETVQETTRTIQDANARTLSKQLYGESKTALRTFETLLKQSAGYAPGFFPTHTRHTQEQLGRQIGQLHLTYQKFSEYVGAHVKKEEESSSDLVSENPKENLQISAAKREQEKIDAKKAERLAQLKTIYAKAEFSKGKTPYWVANNVRQEISQFNPNLENAFGSFSTLICVGEPHIAVKALDKLWQASQSPFKTKYTELIPQGQEYIAVDEKIQVLSRERNQALHKLKETFSTPQIYQSGYGSLKSYYVKGYELTTWDGTKVGKGGDIVVHEETLVELSRPIIAQFDAQIIPLVEKRSELEAILVDKFSRARSSRKVTRSEFKHAYHCFRKSMRDARIEAEKQREEASCESNSDIDA